MHAEGGPPASPKPPNTGGVDNSLSFMYVVAALLLLVGFVVIVIMMFVPSDWRSFAGGSGEAVYVPGSEPGFTPISPDAALTEPPGVYPLERGRYRVVLVAYNWEFDPKEIRLPVGAEVEILARSDQDYHGIAIAGTDMLVQLFHNQVVRLNYTFDQPGVYPFLCAEYCGAGHAAMTGSIIVE